MLNCRFLFSRSSQLQTLRHQQTASNERGCAKWRSLLLAFILKLCIGQDIRFPKSEVSFFLFTLLILGIKIQFRNM